MDKLILKLFGIQLLALAGIVALLPATHYFGLDLIHGAFSLSASQLSGMGVYLGILACGGRWLIGSRWVGDPKRWGWGEAPEAEPAYARYVRRFGKPFLPGTRGSVQVAAAGAGEDPELDYMAERFETAMQRKLRYLEQKEEEQRNDFHGPLLV